MRESILPYLPSGIDFKLPSVPRPRKGKRRKSPIKMGRGPGDPYGGFIGDGGAIGGDGGDGGGGGVGEAIDDYAKPAEFTYSSAMLNLNDEISNMFIYWAKKMISPKDLFISDGEGIDGYSDTPHVTVKYGLLDETPEKVAELSKDFGIIQLQFGNVTKFCNQDFDVIKVDVVSEKLMKLNQIINDNMENIDEYKYKPHTTLAYVKKGTCEDLMGNDFFSGLNDFIHEIYFTSKTGEDYFISLI